MILIIDTTCDKSQVVLAENSQILGQKIFNANFRHSEKLLPAILVLIKKRKIKPNDLKAIVVITGPGSFTGCRVGVATANALSFALNIKITGINKVEIISTPPVAAVFEISKRLKEKDFFAKKTILEIVKVAEKRLKTKIGKFAAPFYEKPPHITKPKPIL